MAGPSLNTCSPWATIDDLCGSCASIDYDTLDTAQMERSLQVASNLLYVLSGRQFPGTCDATVRPCSRRVWENPPSRYLSSTPASFGCGCSSSSKCGCPRPSEISLGVEPIVSIEEVKVDGVVLDSSLYRVDDYRYLVRLPDPDGSYQSWPCCSNILLEDDQLDTFSVTFTYGYTPPDDAVQAAAILGCEFYLSCNPTSGAECRLPRRVQSITRQGVSMVLLDPMEFLALGRLGIHEVDAFIAAYNPHNLRRNSGVYSPDIGPKVRRVATTTGGSGGFGGGGYGE